MDEQEIKICKMIADYIVIELHKWIEDTLFTVTSLNNLGELYYNHIKNEVPGATDELIKKAIEIQNPRNVSCSTDIDYYQSLCRIFEVKRLPKEVLNDVQKIYDDVFVHKYSVVMQKYTTEMTKINSELFRAKKHSKKISQAVVPTSFLRDISSDEQSLYELYSKCNSLRTRKEMIEFSNKYLHDLINDFCDIKDSQSIKKAIQKEAIYWCKEDKVNENICFHQYKVYLNLLEDDLDRPYAIYFKIKINYIIEKAHSNYHCSNFTKTTDEALNDVETFISNIPPFDDMNNAKLNNPTLYCEMLEKMITNYNIIEVVRTHIEKSVCLRDRKTLLLKALKLYDDREFDAFNCMLPVQIEGIFADFLKDSTTFLRFKKMNLFYEDVLKEKIDHLQDLKSVIFPEAVEYFMYYFNNMIRNKIAHGRYEGFPDNVIEDEIFAKELVLDLITLIYMVSRKSETEKMYDFIHRYKSYYNQMLSSTTDHQLYEPLFNDLIGAKVIIDYDKLERLSPIQVAYWLLNPYYEKIYEKVADKSELIDLRNEFLSAGFWKYVLDRLSDVREKGYDYLNINREALSVVNGLFKCNVSCDVNLLLREVSKILRIILSFDTNSAL